MGGRSPNVGERGARVATDKAVRAPVAAGVETPLRG